MILKAIFNNYSFFVLQIIIHLLNLKFLLILILTTIKFAQSIHLTVLKQISKFFSYYLLFLYYLYYYYR